MKHRWAVSAAILCATLLTAAGAHAQAAAPFPLVETAPPPRPSHRLADGTLVGGIALIAASFALERRADQAYDQYLVAVDPAAISNLYSRTVRYDHDSSAALICGNALIATGLFLRFVHSPRPSRLSLAVDVRACAVHYSF